MGTDDEHKMVEALLKLLSDTATEVQGVAVKWCARLAASQQLPRPSSRERGT